MSEIVKNNLKKNVSINVQVSNDDRSYHISSEKIKRILNFNPKKSIDDAVKDLVYAFEKKILVNTFNNDNYFNIKKMQNINLK